MTDIRIRKNLAAFCAALVSAAAFSAPAFAAPVNGGADQGRFIQTSGSSGFMGFGSRAQSADIWQRFRKGFAMQTVSPGVVDRFENSYSASPESLARIASRAEPYLYHIISEVERRGMPSEVALLPFIESAFVVRAKSPVGAAGIWQFMPATGKNFGLSQSKWYDGRNDFFAATDAALDYLQMLHGMFGDWALAFAAYNCGENRVKREVDRAIARGEAPVFDNLNLPNETRNYVPKLLAVRNVVANPASHGVSLPRVKNEPFFSYISLNQPVDMKVIAKLSGLSESDVRGYNPGHNIPVWVPRKDRMLLLPTAAGERFMRNYELSDPSKLLSWQIYQPSAPTRLSDVAAAAGMSVERLRSVNNTSADVVNPGGVLIVSRDADLSSIGRPKAPDASEIPVLASASSSQNGVSYASYEPRPSIPSIPPAIRFDENGGIEGDEPTLQDIVASASGAPKVAQKTNAAANRPAVVKKSAPRYKTIVVKRGQSLTRLAAEHGVTIAELKRANNLRGDQINVGQRLRVAQ